MPSEDDEQGIQDDGAVSSSAPATAVSPLPEPSLEVVSSTDNEPYAVTTSSITGSDQTAQTTPVNSQAFNRTDIVSWEKHRARGNYSSEEKALLVHLREDTMMSWQQIVKEFPGRKKTGLRRRYGACASERKSVPYRPGVQAWLGQLQHLRNSQAFVSSHTPEHSQARTLRWDKSEEELLIQFREVERLTWSEIEARLPYRTEISVHRHYRRLCKDKK